MSKVGQFSYRYQLGRYWINFSFKRIFYRRFEVRGREKLGKNNPLLIASNHQNALMDALVYVTTLRQQPAFVSRADVFSNRLIKTFLTFINMMPVWRIRDGFRSVTNNEQTFNQSTELLARGGALVIFPEGNHDDKRRIRPYKKGLARIAFAAEEASDWKLGLKVVPAGLDYSNYENVRSRLSVGFGDPILVSELRALYEEDPQLAYKELNCRIQEGIAPHMINIPWLDVYPCVLDLRTIYGNRYRDKHNLPNKTLFNKLDADIEMIQKIGVKKEEDSQSMEHLSDLSTQYRRLLKKMDLRDHIPENAPYSTLRILMDSLILLIGFPLFILGFVSNFHLVRIPQYVGRKLFKDPQFKATVAYVLSLVVMLPVCYALQTLIVWWIFHSLWITLAYLVTALPTGLFMLHYTFWLKKLRARIRFMSLRKKKDENVLRLIELRKQIVVQMDQWMA